MNPMIPSPHALQPSALAKLSLRDKLLLAQAVHEIGTSPPDWGRVSALLLAHPLIRQQSRLEQAANAGLTLGRIFGTRECERAWIALMRQRGLVLGKDEIAPEPATPTTPKPKEARGLQPRTDRRSQLALAQLLYAERMEELKEHIREKEEQFKTLVKEIDEIKSGKADARLEMELRIEMENLANGPPLPPSTPGSAAPSVAGPATPASNASTTPKSAKAKGRARGESSATAADLSKMSPTRSDATGSAPNSASKKVDLVKTRRGSDRRASIDDSPTKLVPGPMALPSTPSITLPRPTSGAAPAAAATPATSAAASAANGDASVSTTDKPADAMTTEEAEKAVASAATEAAVKVLQDETAASKVLQQEVDKAAERLVETGTNMELSAQAEGNADAKEASATEPSASTSGAPTVSAAGAEKDESTQPSIQPNEAPAAEVVIKEKEPEVDTTSQDSASAAESTAPATGATSTAAAAAAAAASTKRKRDGSEPASTTSAAPESEPKATASTSESASPTKKARTSVAEKVPSSDLEMDSEDEAEAAVGVDEAQAVQSQDSTTAAEAQEASAAVGAKGAAAEPVKESGTAMDEDSSSDSDSSDDEAEDQVKSVESPRKRSPAKEEATAEAKGVSDEAGKADADDDDDDLTDGDDRKPTPSSRSRATPKQRQSSTTSRPSKPTPPPNTREQAALKRKTTQVLFLLLTEVSNHTHGNLFHAPIKEQDAPDYYTLIKQPLDIKTIRARIKEGSIADAKQLRRSLTLMFANSLVYNRPGTEVHRMASEMFAASEEIFRRFEGTQRF